MNRVVTSLLGALALTATVGCGPQFDAPSEVKTLRVLGVKKDKPYAQPGETVSLDMLWHDPKGRKGIETLFLGGCVNPPGDLYYGCFAQFGQNAAKGEFPPFEQNKNSFQVTLPKDIISGRGDVEPGQPRYGLYIVFFAVCAGSIQLQMDAKPGQGSEGMPILCVDKDGQPLGSDDFVVGYSSIYSFDGVSNKNPEFRVNDAGQTTFSVAGGDDIIADCVGTECQGADAVEVDCDKSPERCVAPCKDDGDAACPAIEVKPAIDVQQERDDVSSDLFKNEVTEQMWINYYVDHGSISDARLLNDTNSGWNDKYRAQLRAPKDAGPLQVWAVIHDNRGGMEFARVTLGVKE